ncbi:MAG: hypothetical protein K9J30_09890 [Bacteroidales bacterium]|nr:hypothetical protein [Bacteroidales bacterium]
MASIRKLKKDINVLTYHLLSRCYAYKNFEADNDAEQFDAIIKKIVYLRNDLIQRANHPENDAESKNMREHFRKVQEDLYELMNTFEYLKNHRI